MSEPIYHLALLREWEAARAAGEYRRSTLELSLEEEGFIHCSAAHQVDGVASRYYADVTEPLVRLEIDPDRAGDVRWEDSGSGERFPHLYGPLPIDAVVAATPYRAIGSKPEDRDESRDQGPGTGTPTHD